MLVISLAGSNLPDSGHPHVNDLMAVAGSTNVLHDDALWTAGVASKRFGPLLRERFGSILRGAQG